MNEQPTSYVEGVAILADFAERVPQHVFMHEALQHAQEQRLPDLATINRWRRSLGWHALEELT